MLFSHLPYPVPSTLSAHILRLKLQEPTNNMATIPIATIVQCCGMSTTTARNRIIADMMSPPEGLKHLNGETSKEMLGTFRDYARSDKEYGNIIFTGVQQRRLISLMDWLKDKNRLEEEASFTDGQQGRNLHMNLRKPQPGRSAENNKRKLGNI